MNRVATSVAAIVLGIAMGLATLVPSAYAKSKVDCDAVMSELNGGKKPKEVATDMKISASSVYRCKKKAKAADTTAAKAGGEASPAASPAAAPKP